MSPDLNVNYNNKSSPPFFSPQSEYRGQGRQRSKSLQETVLPRIKAIDSSQKTVSAELVKRAKREKLGTRLVKDVSNDIKFDLVSVGDVKRRFFLACLKSFKESKPIFPAEKDLVKWIYQQVASASDEQLKKTDLLRPQLQNLDNLLRSIERYTRDKTSEEVEEFKKLIRTILRQSYGSCADFALYFRRATEDCKTKSKKKLIALATLAIAGNSELAGKLLDFFVECKRDQKIIEELALAFFIHRRTQNGEMVFEGTGQELQRLKISFSDVRRHVIHEGKMIIQKIVINDAPINYLDLIGPEKHMLPEGEVNFYQKIVQAVCKAGLYRTISSSEVQRFAKELMTADTAVDCTPIPLKIMKLLETGTINFWSKGHAHFLRSIELTDSSKFVEDSGTTWNIHVTSETSMSLTQMRSGRIQRRSATDPTDKLLSILFCYKTTIRFLGEGSSIKSSLEIVAMTPKEKMNTSERELVLQTLRLVHCQEIQ